MGVEVEGSELPMVNGEAKAVVNNTENGEVNVSEPITFGSHVVDEDQSKGETKNVSNTTNLPKDAVDEWPAERQIYPFWIVKYRSYEDSKLKSEMEKLDGVAKEKSALITKLYKEIEDKKKEKDKLHLKLSSLGEEKSQYQVLLDQKRKEMKPLKDALGDLRGPAREKGVPICSSEEELNGMIRSMEYRIQHESLTLKEEKQILRDLKEFEATRPKVVANAAMRAKVQESMGTKETIHDQVKLLGTDLDKVRKSKVDIQAKRDGYHQDVNILKDTISKLYNDVKGLKEKRQAAFDALQELRNKRDAENTDYFQNRTIISSVKDLANKKDVKALEELVNTEVENFMSQWNCNKSFRTNYEKRILLSLDMRQLSIDGRMRNFDEKPLVKAETLVVPEPTHASKASSKPQKEVSKMAPKTEELPVEKAEAETKKGNKESKTILERSMEEDVFVVEKPKKNLSNGSEIDAAKMKEVKKEEEKEKQRQALERKKKLQEKAAAKAALRAQKEAEKKQKDRERKLKKKEGSSAQPTDEEEASEKADLDESEKSDNIEDAIETPAPPKAKEQKENSVRHRKTVKSRGTLPKAILKKKKSANYWVWASAGGAALVVLMLIVLGYNYLQRAQVVG